MPQFFGRQKQEDTAPRQRGVWLPGVPDQEGNRTMGPEEQVLLLNRFGQDKPIGTRELGRAVELLTQVGIPSPEERLRQYPHQLSGGMQQRTAIARALAYAPSFLLMDEPFAALDHFTRTQLQKELIRLQKSQNTGILFVTHSIDEALLLGHKIAFIEDGCIKKEFLLDTDCENRDLLSKELIELKREILAQLHL